MLVLMNALNITGNIYVRFTVPHSNIDIEIEKKGNYQIIWILSKQAKTIQGVPKMKDTI